MKKFMSKSLALVLAFVLVFAVALTGCGKKTSDDNSSTGDNSGTEPTSAATATSGAEATTAPSTDEPFILDVSVGGEPETIDPTMNTAVDGSTYINHLFEGLMKVDANKEVVPGQAASYTVSDDGTVYTFTLRDDIKWSDGQPVTAKDFVYSWQRLVDPATASEYNYMLDGVKNANDIMAGTKDKSELGVKAIDDKTFEVTLNVATPYFLEICAFPGTYPLREDIISANPDTWTQDPSTLIGNGPYQLVSWEHQSMITMKQNPNYYDAANLGPDQINFHLIEDPTTALASFENGEILFSDTLPNQEIQRMTDKGLYIEGQLGTYFLCINNENETLKDAKVRQALALAIDRQYIVDTVAQGGQQPADTYVPTGLSDTDTSKEFHDVANKWWDNTTYDANCEKAKQLLADAGYPNGEGFPSLELSFNPGHEDIMEAITYMWKQVLNIDVTMSSQDWAVFIQSRQDGDYDIARHGWLADYNDPISFLDMWVTDGGNNDAQYSNPAYDDLINTAKTSADRATRMTAMHQAEDILAQDMPIIPIYYYTDLFLKSDKLSGFYTSPLGYKYFSYSKVTE